MSKKRILQEKLSIRHHKEQNTFFKKSKNNNGDSQELEVDTSPHDTSSSEHVDIFEAAKAGNIELVSILLTEMHDINQLGGVRNLSLLHYAIFSNNLNLVELILKQPKIDIEICNYKDPGTPLYLAATRKEPNVEIIKKLSEMGASTLAKNQYQKNILHSMTSDNVEVLELILKHSVGQEQDLINATTSRNWTPLHAAISSNHPKIIKFLLENKAKITADHIYLAGYNGNVTALELLAKKEHIALEKINYKTLIGKIEEGFDLNQHKDNSMLEYDLSLLGLQEDHKDSDI